MTYSTVCFVFPLISSLLPKFIFKLSVSLKLTQNDYWLRTQGKGGGQSNDYMITGGRGGLKGVKIWLRNIWTTPYQWMYRNLQNLKHNLNKWRYNSIRFSKLLTWEYYGGGKMLTLRSKAWLIQCHWSKVLANIIWIENFSVGMTFLDFA